MISPNTSHLETLSVESLTLWNNVTSNLTEFVLGNWWVGFVVLLLTLSCVKHSLMCWEVRQDKRRLRCCYIRYCALRSAAERLQHQDYSEEEESKERDAVTGYCRTKSGADAVPNDEETTATAVDAVKPVEASTPAVTEAKVKKVTLKPFLCLKRPAVMSAPTSRMSLDDAYSPTSSLRNPLTSTSSSDFSFSSPFSPISVTQHAAAATSRLLNRLSLSPGVVDEAPSSARLPPKTSADFVVRRNVCFPRYTEDERRLLDEKRQANAQAWMEAKRALESTENLTSGCASPTLSMSRRKTTTNSGASVKVEGL